MRALQVHQVVSFLQHLRRHSTASSVPALPTSLPVRRVVVTGLGIVSPLGVGVCRNWNAILSGASGLQATPPWLSELPSRVVGLVPRAAEGSGAHSPPTAAPEPPPATTAFSAANYVDRAGSRTQSADFIAFALAAAAEALADAGLVTTAPGSAIASYEGAARGSGLEPRPLPATADSLSTAAAPAARPPPPSKRRLGPYLRSRFGVSIGSGIGGIEEAAQTAQLIPPSMMGPAALAAASTSGAGEGGGSGGVRKISPFFVPRILCNMAAGNASIRFGLGGPQLAPATACASGAHAIGDAFRAIKYGHADAMLAGGSEAAVGALAMSGFSRAKALSTAATAPLDAAAAKSGESANDSDASAASASASAAATAVSASSRPFDQRRDGFVLGEGAGVLVLEELSAARARGARIYAEVRGYGSSGDAFHVTQPRADGDGALRSMVAALEEGGVLRPRPIAEAVDGNEEEEEGRDPPAAATARTPWFAHERYSNERPGGGVGGGDASPLPVVDYINAHATSTPLGDEIEGVAIGRLLGSAITRRHLATAAAVGVEGAASKRKRAAGDGSASGAAADSGINATPLGARVAVSSSKGAIGHLLGAAGAVESIFTILAVHTGIAPPTANLEKLDTSLPTDTCDFVSAASSLSGGASSDASLSPSPPSLYPRRRIALALKNSFGFGGTNCSILFSSAPEDE